MSSFYTLKPTIEISTGSDFFLDNKIPGTNAHLVYPIGDIGIENWYPTP